jgi:hypothetical protein
LHLTPSISALPQAQMPFHSVTFCIVVRFFAIIHDRADSFRVHVFANIAHCETKRNSFPGFDWTLKNRTVIDVK